MAYQSGANQTPIPSDRFVDIFTISPATKYPSLKSSDFKALKFVIVCVSFKDDRKNSCGIRIKGPMVFFGTTQVCASAIAWASYPISAGIVRAVANKRQILFMPF